jgi:hypothetical protein
MTRLFQEDSLAIMSILTFDFHMKVGHSCQQAEFKEQMRSSLGLAGC